MTQQEESTASRAFTAALGLGLLGAMAMVAYAWTLPSPNERSRARSMDMETAALSVAANEAVGPLDAGVEEHAADETARAEPEQADVAEPRKHRTGKKIVDPRIVAARSEVVVTMYAASWCFICDRARAFLEARDVQLIEYDVDRDELAAKKLAGVNASASIPTFVVDDKVIVGFHPWGLEDAIDEAAQDKLCGADDHAVVCERPETASAR